MRQRCMVLYYGTEYVGTYNVKVPSSVTIREGNILLIRNLGYIDVSRIEQDGEELIWYMCQKIGEEGAV